MYIYIYINIYFCFLFLSVSFFTLNLSVSVSVSFYLSHSLCLCLSLSLSLSLSLFSLSLSIYIYIERESLPSRMTYVSKKRMIAHVSFMYLQLCKVMLWILQHITYFVETWLFPAVQVCCSVLPWRRSPRWCNLLNSKIFMFVNIALSMHFRLPPRFLISLNHNPII